MVHLPKYGGSLGKGTAGLLTSDQEFTKFKS